ncbi:MAG: hypothetical protein IJ273_01135, partial [Alphaproteobacteria bacterium]|nr:hypothetical protein [Alphaproteobacteria bacterium]
PHLAKQNVCNKKTNTRSTTHQTKIKMYSSLKRILRSMAHSEAMSKIHSQEWNARMRACRRAFDTATARRLKHLRNENTKHK